MGKKKNDNKLSVKKILIHFAAICATAVLLVFLTLAYLNIYTRHGQSVDVPRIEGLQISEAQSILRAKGLRINILDSIYVRDAVPGAIFDQKPSPNNNVKIGRTVYVTIFASNPRAVAVPDVEGYTQRQVMARLNSMGFDQIAIHEEPSPHAGLVLGVEYRGRRLEPGERVPQGSPLRLIVGAGTQVEEEVDVTIPVGSPQAGIDNSFQ